LAARINKLDGNDLAFDQVIVEVDFFALVRDELYVGKMARIGTGDGSGCEQKNGGRREKRY
jgi:hypothetical protein